MTLWQYTAMLAVHNKRHAEADNGAGEPVVPPTEDEVRAAQAELYELGIAGRVPS